MGYQDSRTSTTPSIVGLVGLCLVAAVVLWFTLGDGGSRVSAFLKTPASPAAGRVPSQAPTASPKPPNCEPAQVQLTGAFESCADPTGHCDRTTGTGTDYYGLVTALHDLRHRYVVHVAIDGAYHGPDGYQLSPWGDAGINAHDGISKILLADQSGGASWQSTSGFLLIYPSGRGTMVDATFQRVRGAIKTGASPDTLQLTASGTWTCLVS
ncbi:MAG TPA: hypothetical protein VNV65_08150 [Candidatus Solibacter sp.]|jgi:hypothetical protein|nr:hypothetical protein [Candidatus Solibacter sp.]